MENKGLIFIPDISGFEKFVHETEIEHGSYIIQNLLEELINANDMKLEISEIEGDAILFFKFGERPTLEVLYQQVAKMFCNFHAYLMAYENQRFCQCRACVAASKLTLKVVAHFGEFTKYRVKNFNKLIGKGIILAHQLLKNDIAHHEYWLVTQELLNGDKPVEFKEWMQWYAGLKTTENGQIPFQYTMIGRLKSQITPYHPAQLEPLKKIKMAFYSEIFQVDIKKLFFTTIQLQYRERWLDGVKSVEKLDHSLPGLGSRYRCIFEDRQSVFYSSGFSYNPYANIVFSETDESSKDILSFSLERLDNNNTRFSLELFLKRNYFNQLAFKLFRKKAVEKGFYRSMSSLKGLLEEITVATEL
ncbi:DUF2652 domain-containing protein [Dyadobacter chenhuakuii]|uniref:DUF2652 domain-containing protein n=1 Tax=Dyadobacter chenhuakuii TaxID=2909339 RepID=A0A9X1TYY9_9BACT|nr:DUF2652 domain-containing protein [Dyadobacter chenhuakuii]MCF2496721.1 DUF2652 domain-containing protein [Dyadobacter chenhuakuii]